MGGQVTNDPPDTPWPPPDVEADLAKIAKLLHAAVSGAYSLGFGLAMARPTVGFGNKSAQEAVREVLAKTFEDKDISWGKQEKAECLNALTEFLATQIWWGILEGSK